MKSFFSQWNQSSTTTFVLQTNQTVEPSLFGVLVRTNSIYCGIHLKALSLPEQCSILGILRNRQVVPLAENPVIFRGDYILAMAHHPMRTPTLKWILNKVHPVYYSSHNCLLKSQFSAQLPTANQSNLSQLLLTWQ
jgi:NhaP-type Na+/H+ and K+/H+ antiporter